MYSYTILISAVFVLGSIVFYDICAAIIGSPISQRFFAQNRKREMNKMNFHTRKWVKPEDLNPNGTLFGGSLLKWIDEEAAIYTICQLGNNKVVTKYMSEINFVSSATLGDIIEMGLMATSFGNTSITLTCEVRNKITRQRILTINKIVFVNIDDNFKPLPHGKTEITYSQDRFKD